jgi:hypothetical protein
MLEKKILALSYRWIVTSDNLEDIKKTFTKIEKVLNDIDIENQ